MAMRLTVVALVSLISFALLSQSRICAADETANKEKPAAEAPAAEAPVKQLSSTEVYNEMLPATCWLKIDYLNNGVPWEKYGTGWVYDVERRLIVTNEHVVHGYDTIFAYFPETVDGELQHDPDWYRKNGKKFTGKVIDRSTSLDLALVQLDGVPDNAVALKMAEKSPLPGERLFVLGGLPAGSEGLWIMGTGEVRQVYRRSHANGHLARVVETQVPTNGGNSGGAVVNDRLQVVAVVEGEMLKATLVRMFIDVNEVRDYLAECDPLIDPASAADFETRAARRHDEHRYDQAIADYSAALKLEPKRTSAIINRGWVYFWKKDYETAKADFEAAIKIDPEDREAYAGRGTCKRELGDYKAAIVDLTEAIRRDGAVANDYERRAKCYVALEEHEKALKDRNQAVQLAPDDVDYLLSRGQSFRALKRYSEAQKDMEKAISLNPQNSVGYYELGHVYMDQKQYPQARMFFDMAVQRIADAPEYFSMRGIANLRMEQNEQAIADLNQAIRLKPDTSYYYWNVGIAYWNLDRFEESAQAYSDYIRLDPDERKGYEERADVYDQMDRADLAAQDRATAKKLKREKK